ncbi:MAG: succinylglutamate desuccinylase/aspartoacylase family protein [Rubellimicrobium sp.]|nr:succinylglutamate desuccinylase/aspartoacylase family protein [Rubellimicrobium sp.]
MNEIRRHPVVWGNLPDGTPLEFSRITVDGSGHGLHVGFVGGVHGDEYEGPLALLDLAARLAELPLRGKVTILPFVNSPALWTATRTSPFDGANLARIFPGDTEGTLSHQLARAVWNEVRGMDALVDCHSGGIANTFAPVAGFYAAGGVITEQAAIRSRDLARATGLPLLWRLPATPGVLSREAAAAGIAVTGCEVGGRGDAQAGDVAIYLDAFLRVLAHLEMLDAAFAPAPHAPQQALHGDWIVAPAAGLLRKLVPVGSSVRRGTPCARIESPEGRTLAEIVAPDDGFILAERNVARVHAGDLAVLVAQILP